MLEEIWRLVTEWRKLDGLTTTVTEIKAIGIGSSWNKRKLVYHLKDHGDSKISRMVSKHLNLENISYLRLPYS